MRFQLSTPFRSIVAAAAFSASPFSHAAPVTPPTDLIPIPSAPQIRSGQEAATPAPNTSAEVPTPDADQGIPRELGKPADDVTVDVTRYQIDGLPGASPATREALAAVTAPYVGKARHYEDLVNAAAAVTRYMQRDLGYYLGYAYLPEQEPAQGTVRIVALEGRLDQVVLNWPDNMAIKREVVERYLAHLKPGEILRVRDVERVVFLVNDLQGLRARFEVKAGRTPGTASLVVTPQAEPRVSGRGELDINGSRYSGIARASATVALGNPLGIGDGLVFNGLNSLNNGLSFALLSYVAPVGSEGWKLGGSFSLVHYKLDQITGGLDLKGRAVALNSTALYPVVRSRNLNVFSVFAYEHKEFVDERLGGLSRDRKGSNDFSATLVGDFRDNFATGGVNTYELGWTFGHLNYSAPSSPLKPNNDSPTFNKYSLGYSRLQNLISNRLLMYLRFKAQATTTNLDSSERFSLGGPNGVRAFAPGETPSDEGQLLTTELRFLPPENWFGRASREIVLSAFYDFGKARQCQDPDPNRPYCGLTIGANPSTNNVSLSSAGVGFTWDRQQSFGLRMMLAWPINGEPVSDPQKRNPRAYASLTKYF